MSFVIHWLVLAVAVGVSAYLLPGVSVSSGGALAVAALVLGLVNALVRPLLTILTLPLTVVTLGLFYLVVNGVSFAIAAWLVPGFHVSTLSQAILGALIASLVSWVLGAFRR